MLSELDRLHQTAKEEYEALCSKEKEIQIKKVDLEKVITFLEGQMKRKNTLLRVDKPPLNDFEPVHVPIKRNKMAFMIKICTKGFEGKFSQQDVINYLKKNYSTFDSSTVPYYLHELTMKKIIHYDGLQYEVVNEKKRKYANRGINVSGEIKQIVLNELGEDSLAFNVSRVFDKLIAKYPQVSIPRKIVTMGLIKLEEKGELTSQPGIHARAPKIYSVAK